MAGVEYVFISIRVTIQEKEALRKAANKEKRPLANYLLNASLERAEKIHDVLPMYDDEECLQEG